MSPTVLRVERYRFFFFSREETRIHVHVTCPDGEAKFWLEPIPALARNHRLTPKQLGQIQRILEEHIDEIKKAWKTHFQR
jgi:hypothetical protein